MNPEYYKCIKSEGYNDGFTEGKIYKIKDPDNLEAACNFINDRGEENGYSGTNHKHFTPSTYEEYCIQENIPIEYVKEDYSYILKILEKLENEC